jgi:DNA polymerase zeta
MDDAFRIGEEIAEAVTSAMKPPIKLQLEKIYLPCMLFAKKRYAGMKYEKRNSKPEFEAKGIETVRRDGCGVVRRILKRTLMALFSCGLRKNKDDELVPASTLRRVRAEVEREWRNILSGHVSLRDLTFWKGVRLGTYVTFLFLSNS